MKKHQPFIGSVVIFLYIASQAYGIFVYDDYDQFRSVSAIAVSTDQVDSTSSDHFHQTAETSYVNTHSTWSKKTYRSCSDQDSSLMNETILFNGNCSISDPFYHQSLPSLGLSACSYFNIDFSVDTSCQILLSGTLNAEGDYGGTQGWPTYNTFIKLTEGGATELFSMTMLPYLYYDSDSYSWPIDSISAITLDSGITYNLEIMTSLNCIYSGSDELGYDIGGGGDVSIDLAIEIIPEPASILLIGLGCLAFRLKQI